MDELGDERGLPSPSQSARLSAGWYGKLAAAYMLERASRPGTTSCGARERGAPRERRATCRPVHDFVMASEFVAVSRIGSTRDRQVSLYCSRTGRSQRIPSLHCLEAGVGQGVNSSVQNFGMQVETGDHWARSTVWKRDCNIDWLVAEEITQLDRRLPLILANHGQLRGHSGAAGAQALPAAHGHQPGHSSELLSVF
eukprot:s7023_g2.t1